MVRWLRPSEHRHPIARQPGGDEIKAFAIPSPREPARKPKLASRKRDIALPGPRNGDGLNGPKQLWDVTKIARRPDNRCFHPRDLGR